MCVNERVNILIVDDKSQNLLGMESLLQAPDRNIVKAISGKEALDSMLEREFAAVLLDVQMTDMDGFETAQLMRSNPKTRHIPIIFVTPISKEQKHIYKGYEAGAVDYLFKPFDPIILETKIGVFIDLYKQSKSLEDTTKELEQAVRSLKKANMTIKEQQESIIEQERLKTLLQMAGATAHELGQPLTVLLGNIELMGLYKDNPEKLAQGMANIREAGKRISAIAKKIQNIRNTETTPYLKNMSIIDLDQH